MAAAASSPQQSLSYRTIKALTEEASPPLGERDRKITLGGGHGSNQARYLPTDDPELESVQ